MCLRPLSRLIFLRLPGAGSLQQLLHRLMVVFLILGNDCGVFVIQAVCAIARAFLEGDREPKFPTQTEIYAYRHQIAVEILDAFEN
jgi:hypothetical protein